MAHILVVEIEPLSAEQLCKSLSRAGHQVQAALAYEQAHQILAGSELDLVIAVERQGPGPVQQLLEATQRMPLAPAVIVLGERHYDYAVAAFRSGAADYLRMPCSPARLQTAVQTVLNRRSRATLSIQALHQIREQIAAIQAVLDRLETLEHGAVQERSASNGRSPAASPAASPLFLGPLTLGQSRKEVLLNGEPLALSPIEYRLLRCLAETPNEAVHFEQIVAQTHAYEVTKAEANGLLKSHLRNLRRKLPPGCLVTVRGVGLMLRISALAQPDLGPAALELEFGA